MKQIILLSALLLTVSRSSGQTIHFHFNDGSQEVFQVSDVRKTTFNGADILLHLFDGTVYTWDMASIDHYRYNELVTSNEAVSSSSLAWKSLYPNPTDGILNGTYTIRDDEEIHIRIMDMLGQEVRRMNFGKQLSGQHSFRWNGTDNNGSPLPRGTYICQLVLPKSSVSRTFVIN